LKGLLFNITTVGYTGFEPVQTLLYRIKYCINYQ